MSGKPTRTVPRPRETAADARVWRALADPTRRRLLDLLRDAPRTTGDLARRFDETKTRFAVMKHLAVLVDAGLVVVRREGRERWNHLNPVPIRRVYERWVEPHAAGWAKSIARLERTLREEEER